jgi:hypothetical protein
MTSQTFTEADLKTSTLGDGNFEYRIEDQTAQVNKNSDGAWDLIFRDEIVPGYTRKQDAKEAAIAAILAILNEPEAEAILTPSETQTVGQDKIHPTTATEPSTDPKRRKAKIAPIYADPNTVQTQESEPGKFTISMDTTTGTRLISKRVYQTLNQVQNASKRYISFWTKGGEIQMKNWLAA